MAGKESNCLSFYLGFKSKYYTMMMDELILKIANLGLPLSMDKATPGRGNFFFVGLPFLINIKKMLHVELR